MMLEITIFPPIFSTYWVFCSSHVVRSKNMLYLKNLKFFSKFWIFIKMDSKYLMKLIHINWQNNRTVLWIFLKFLVLIIRMDRHCSPHSSRVYLEHKIQNFNQNFEKMNVFGIWRMWIYILPSKGRISFTHVSPMI